MGAGSGKVKGDGVVVYRFHGVNAISQEGRIAIVVLQPLD